MVWSAIRSILTCTTVRVVNAVESLDNENTPHKRIARDSLLAVERKNSISILITLACC
jgi:hypothetical protein